MNKNTHQVEGNFLVNASEYYDNKILYNNFVATSLNNQENAVTGCTYCNVECSNAVPFDERNIIEVYSKGVAGLLFCEISGDFEGELNLEDEVIFNHDGILENGIIKATGELVRAKRKRLGLHGEEIPSIIRKLTSEDKIVLEHNKDDEQKARESFHSKLIKFNLEMKLVDVHYQFDRNKLYFFYTADGRVDFRELAKNLASEFRTRIELRQIGVRDEAKRIGGIGICGREFCCSSFLGTFKRITTQLANDQNYSSNISKLSGPCGKLKCCLSYEINECPQVNESENSSSE